MTETDRRHRDPFGQLFPLTGKVMLVGLGLRPELLEKYQNRIHICAQSQINDGFQTPPCVAAVLISGRLPPLVIQRIRDWALAKKIPYVTVENDLPIFRRHLNALLKKVDLSVDPAKKLARPKTKAAHSLTLLSQPFQPRNYPPRHPHPKRFW